MGDRVLGHQASVADRGGRRGNDKAREVAAGEGRSARLAGPAGTDGRRRVAMSRVHRASVGNVELVALQDTYLRPKLTDFFPEAAGDVAGAVPGSAQRRRRAVGEHHAVADPQRRPHHPGRYGHGRPAGRGAAGGRAGAAGAVGRGGRAAGRGSTSWRSPTSTSTTRAGTPSTATGAPTPLFPNARHVAQQTEWDYWADGATGAEPDRARGLDPITAAGLWDRGRRRAGADGRRS